MVSALALVAAACGATPPGAPAAPPAPTGAAATASGDDEAKTPLARVASAKVYDANGASSACAPPSPSCPPLPVERAFVDRCRLAGYQIRQCGCAARCTGDVSAAGRRWDAEGRAKDCAPAQAECAPAAPSVRFQDACAERGYRLEPCGCEWLCSGDPTKAGASGH